MLLEQKIENLLREEVSEVNENLKELAITNLGRHRGGNNNIIVWVLLFLIICGCNGSGFGNFGLGNFFGDNCGRRKRHCRRRDNNFFGGNGIFIVIVIAILFLVTDGNTNTNIINVDTEDGFADS